MASTLDIWTLHEAAEPPAPPFAARHRASGLLGGDRREGAEGAPGTARTYAITIGAKGTVSMNGAQSEQTLGVREELRPGATGVVADCERDEDGRMQLSASRRMVRTRVQTRSEDADAGPNALPAPEADGVVSRVLLEAVSGGQPLLVTRRAGPPPCWLTPTAGPRWSCSPPRRSRRVALGDDGRMAGMLGGDAVSPRM
jgi:hypothetical protein